MSIQRVIITNDTGFNGITLVIPDTLVEGVDFNVAELADGTPVINFTGISIGRFSVEDILLLLRPAAERANPPPPVDNWLVQDSIHIGIVAGAPVGSLVTREIEPPTDLNNAPAMQISSQDGPNSGLAPVGKVVPPGWTVNLRVADAGGGLLAPDVGREHRYMLVFARVNASDVRIATAGLAKSFLDVSTNQEQTLFNFDAATVQPGTYMASGVGASFGLLPITLATVELAVGVLAEAAPPGFPVRLDPHDTVRVLVTGAVTTGAALIPSATPGVLEAGAFGVTTLGTCLEADAGLGTRLIWMRKRQAAA